MILIHPPLAIIGYVFIFIFTASLLLNRNPPVGKANLFGPLAWVFTLLGLLTGMLWAQIAWGSYWSWDPKETLTLLLFLSVSGGLTAHYEGKPRISKALSILSCIFVFLTLSASFVTAGLHSFLG